MYTWHCLENIADVVGNHYHFNQSIEFISFVINTNGSNDASIEHGHHSYLEQLMFFYPFFVILFL